MAARYEVVETIGRGNFGVVELVRDREVSGRGRVDRACRLPSRMPAFAARLGAEWAPVAG